MAAQRPNPCLPEVRLSRRQLQPPGGRAGTAGRRAAGPGPAQGSVALPLARSDSQNSPFLPAWPSETRDTQGPEGPARGWGGGVSATPWCAPREHPCSGVTLRISPRSDRISHVLIISQAVKGQHKVPRVALIYFQGKLKYTL